MDKETGESLGRGVTAEGWDAGLEGRAADARAQALPPPRDCAWCLLLPRWARLGLQGLGVASGLLGSRGDR